MGKGRVAQKRSILGCLKKVGHKSILQQYNEGLNCVLKFENASLHTLVRGKGVERRSKCARREHNGNVETGA